MEKKTIKLTEEDLKKCVKDVINELSISQKKRNTKNVENLFRKGKAGYNGIKTIVVMTAENPDSQEAARQVNKKNNKKLLSKIKSSGYAYVPAQGKFGNVENPYAIFNMSRETAKMLSGEFQQTSFVYSELLDNGTLHSEYWEKMDVSAPYNKKDNDYVKKDESDRWIDMSDADDFFTIIGNKFKYTIPFSIFENVNRVISNNIKKMIIKENKRGKNSLTENNVLNFMMKGVGISPYLWRKASIEGL